MPKMQIVPKIEPVNCFGKVGAIINIGMLKVNVARRHRPNNEIEM